MYKVITAATAAVLLVFGIAGCGQEEANRTGEMIDEAVKNAGDIAMDTAQKAGKKIQKWTDQVIDDETAAKKPAKPSNTEQGPANAPRRAGEKMASAKLAVGQSSTPEGKSTYQIMCSSCHNSGALGAPRITDKAAWQARIAMGTHALYSSAINGIGAMPPKGGHSQLSEREVKAAVDHIVATVSGSDADGR